MKKIKDFVLDLKDSIPKIASVELYVSKQDSSDKLWYLERQERDFLKITKQNLKEIVETIASEYVKGELVSKPEEAIRQAIEAGGLKYKSIVINRFGSGIKDIPLKPLTKEYIKKKGHSKIGYNTGNLYRDIKSAKIAVSFKK